ncbi:sensor histidine kinase [Pseudomonadota bacterium]
MDKGQLNNPAIVEEEQNFLPNFCTIRNLFLVILTAELLAMVFTLSAKASAAGLAQELSLRSLHVQWIALTGVALLCALRPWLGRLNNGPAGLAAWVLMLSATWLISEAAYYLLSGAERSLQLYSGEHLGFILRSLGISAIVWALGLRYLYVQHLWRRQEVAETQARLQALQSRIRPHFLFNSMNTIASLIRSRPAVAEEAVHDLADLFRASLAQGSSLTTLGDELELARGYLRIESQRLGERLQLEWRLDDLPEQAAIPPLVLQPLLENAVYHGIEAAPEGGRILITGCYKRELVNLSIRNTLPPASAKAHREGNRMAVENIRQRLEGLFGSKAGLAVGEVEGEYQVRLFFPHPHTPST